MEDLTNEIDTEQIQYELALDDFFKKNYVILTAIFIDSKHDEFMEFVEEQYEDKEGEEILWEVK
jgi:type IV secretory pathway component VirB8